MNHSWALLSPHFFILAYLRWEGCVYQQQYMDEILPVDEKVLCESKPLFAGIAPCGL